MMLPVSNFLGPWIRSLRNDGMNVALALVKGTGSPKKGDEFTCGDAAKGMTREHTPAAPR